MISINMYELWSDDINNIIKGVNEAIHNIISYSNNSNASKSSFEELKNDIKEILDCWAGKTYVGNAKNKNVEKAFQGFFEELMKLLLNAKKSAKIYERECASKLLYRGKVYRYLGNDRPNKCTIVPIYNNIYVSWSKEPKSCYIESKLYGTITWMSCEISAPFYGIDLDVLGCSRANEHEVVFPTIEECITEIKYISEDDDDQT